MCISVFFYLYEHMCVLLKKRERERESETVKSVFSQNKTFPKERKVDSMNNTRSYIGIQTHTHTNDIDNNKDESSINVV